MNAESIAIDVQDLHKSYGRQEVLKGIRLQVKRGSVYAILGPNGAGKTTLISILSTLLRPDSGHVKVLGLDVRRQADDVRSRICLTGQFASLDEEMTGFENLVLVARLMGYSKRSARTRATELLHQFELTDAGDRPVSGYSGGMRRRLDIAAGMIETPELLFLDEPTTGLDPRSRGQVWSTVRQLVAGGATVLLTTQYMEEADQLADRIAVLDRGMMIAEGTVAELKRSVGYGTVQVRLDRAEQRAAAAGVLSGLLGEAITDGQDPTLLSVRASDPEQAGYALIELKRAGIAIQQYTLGQPSLDEVFLALTGKPVQDAATTKEAIR